MSPYYDRRVHPGSRTDRILDALREHPGGLTAPQLATITDPGFSAATRPAGVVGIALHRMERRGLVRRKGACRYPVTWQLPPERNPARRRPDDRWEGVVMRDPRTLEAPQDPYAAHPAPCAHRLLSAVLAEMPPPLPGALTEAQLKAWHNVMAAVVEAVYGSPGDPA